MLVQLLKPDNEFELKDLAGSYEEENASESFIFLFDKKWELPAYENPFVTVESSLIRYVVKNSRQHQTK